MQWKKLTPRKPRTMNPQKSRSATELDKVEKKNTSNIGQIEHTSNISISSSNDPDTGADTYSKPIFQRGGESDLEKIRKRYVYSKTHLLQGDGYEQEERKKVGSKAHTRIY